MRFYISILLGFVVFFLVGLQGITAQTNDAERAMERANKLFENYMEKQALEEYQAVLETDPDNYEALWKSGFLFARIGNRFQDEEKKKHYFYKAMEHAQKAMDIDPDNVNSYYSLAVALGRRAIMSKPKQRVAATRKIHRVASNGLDIQGDHAGLLHIMGYMNYRLTNMTKLEKLAANILHGGVPDGSEGEAVDYLESAVEERPDYILYYHDLAKAYIAYDQKKAALETLEKAVSLPEKTPDDPELKSSCEQMLAQINTES